MECEYCKKTFSNKYNVKNHQKRAKYCLAIQQENNIEVDSDLIKCEYCEHLSTPEQFTRHLKTCKEKIKYESTLKDKIINDLKLRIGVLETEVRLLREQNERSTSTVEEIAKQQ